MGIENHQKIQPIIRFALQKYGNVLTVDDIFETLDAYKAEQKKEGLRAEIKAILTFLPKKYETHNGSSKFSFINIAFFLRIRG